jgi:ATP-dependent DNA ligase
VNVRFARGSCRSKKCRIFIPAAGRHSSSRRDRCGRSLRIGGCNARGYVGRRNGDDLVYAGKVDHDFDKVSAADLQKRLKPLIRQTQPYAKRIAHKGIWVEPKLLAEIEYRAKSAEGKVRHPFFRGLREDL